MNMEVPADPHHQTEDHIHHHRFHSPAAAVSSAVQSSFFLSPSHFFNSGYGIGEESGGFYSQSPVMSPKSDVSLCIIEAISRSQQEDVLGCGLNMGSHQNDREGRAPILDHVYYARNPEPKSSTKHPLDFQQHLRQQIQVQQQHLCIQPSREGMISEFTSHEIYEAPVEEESLGDDVITSLKNWVTGNYIAGNSGVVDKRDMGSCSLGAMGYENLQSLGFSMSPGSHSSCLTAPQHIPPATGCTTKDYPTKKRGARKERQKQPVQRKPLDTFGQKTSQYRGVTRHRWTCRYEAHLWDNSCKEGQTRKGKQVYLGGYDTEEKAARAYDLAALKYWGPSTHTNFVLEDYHEELEEMKNMSRQEYLAHLRRKSSGFSRGASIYRGVTRHHQHGRWQARIGRVAGNKDLYLGTFSTQEEAAEAYDIATIKFRGVNAVTNFEVRRYDVDKIMASSALLSAEEARRHEATEADSDTPCIQNSSGSGDLDFTKENNSTNS